MLLRDDLLDSAIPHRDQTREAILQSWQTSFDSLKLRLAVSRIYDFKYTTDFSRQHSCGKISITADAWSSANLSSFLAVTAHWISQDQSGRLALESALIGFQRVHGSHTGKNVAQYLLEILDRADISLKVRYAFFLLAVCMLILFLRSGTSRLTMPKTTQRRCPSFSLCWRCAGHPPCFITRRTASAVLRISSIYVLLTLSRPCLPLPANVPSVPLLANVPSQTANLIFRNLSLIMNKVSQATRQTMTRTLTPMTMTMTMTLTMTLTITLPSRSHQVYGPKRSAAIPLSVLGSSFVFYELQTNARSSFVKPFKMEMNALGSPMKMVFQSTSRNSNSSRT
jgi:hypothetical protein